ncbi:MAG: hypothetical protein ACTSUP_11055 [Candidatus Heimdallarchaeaceae archaeon]
MSDNEVKMYEELLELLENKFDNEEIDKANYSELKERYQAKLEQAKLEVKQNGSAPHIKISGAQVITDTVLSAAGSAKISGGDIPKDIKISGSARIQDDIICRSIKASGSFKSEGSITSHGDVKVSGSFSCKSFLHATGNMKISGSSKVGGELVIGGRMGISGSFRCGNNAQIDQGAKVSGSAIIAGNFISQGTIDTSGKIEVEGNLVGANVFINKNTVFIKLKRRKNSKIKGTLFAVDEVDINKVIVEEDVKGKDVTIGPYSEVKGTVYYVNKIDVHKSAKLTTEPVQISEDQLKL